jgi:hypothetical protein
MTMHRVRVSVHGQQQVQVKEMPIFLGVVKMIIMPPAEGYLPVP